MDGKAETTAETWAANRKRRLHVRGCTGKKRHLTAGDAVAFASHASRNIGPMRPYECTNCGGWHLTTEVVNGQ